MKKDFTLQLVDKSSIRVVSSIPKEGSLVQFSSRVSSQQFRNAVVWVRWKLHSVLLNSAVQ